MDSNISMPAKGEVFDIENHSWNLTPAPTLPKDVGCIHLAAAADKSNIYVVSGLMEQTTYGAFYSYTWKSGLEISCS